MKKILTYIILLSFPFIVWYCSDNVGGINDGPCFSAIYSKDSIYMEIIDTGVTCTTGEDPIYSGTTVNNLKLIFTGETNCDSSMGIPYLHIAMIMNNKSVYSFTTYSKTEINKQYNLYFNKIILKSDFGLIGYTYKLYLTAYIAKGITYGKKYISLKNIYLYCN